MPALLFPFFKAYPRAWGTVVILATLFSLGASSEGLGQNVQPFLQLGAGASTFGGTAWVAGAGAERNGFRILFQFWGGKQVFHWIPVSPPPCEFSNGRISELAYQDKYNDLSLQFGYRLKFSRFMIASAHVGISRFAYLDREFDWEYNFCHTSAGINPGSLAYPRYFVLRNYLAGMGLASTGSIGVALTPDFELNLFYVGTLPITTYRTNEGGLLQISGCLGLVGYF